MTIHQVRASSRGEPGLVWAVSARSSWIVSTLSQERVADLPIVVCHPERPKVLHCSNCAEQITSSWFFVHPSSGACTVLVPNSGHGACRESTGKYCHFRPQDGFASKLDILYNFGFCMHSRMHYQCAECGGGGMRAHGMHKWTCEVCDYQPKRRKLAHHGSLQTT
mmetsp:Transcript_5052/g.18866  ORF Transcript_5052/g.18866 Transcript_5052/m.18866 type:complete len:165 (+) Transcript_5052:150-644(+)